MCELKATQYSWVSANTGLDHGLEYRVMAVAPSPTRTLAAVQKGLVPVAFLAFAPFAFYPQYTNHTNTNPTNTLMSCILPC